MALEDDPELEPRLDRMRTRSDRIPGKRPRNLPMRTISATTTRIMSTHSMRCSFLRPVRRPLVNPS